MLTAITIWLVTGDDAGAPQPAVSSNATGTDVDPTTADSRSAQVAESEDGTADEGPARELAQTPDAPTEDPFDVPEAIFRGRCVDTAGDPMAGINVSVHGWTGNTERREAYEKDHGKVVWEDPEDIVTGPDGRFEVRFVPPPPFQFTVDLARADLVSMTGRWGVIEPGEEKDFGDITFETGAQLTGRLVDKHGALVPPTDERTDIYVNRYNRQDRPRGEIHPRESARARVSPDGSFVFAKRVGLGMWNLQPRGVTLGPDANGEVQREFEIDEAAEQLDIVVLRPEDIETVTGRVLDEEGRPVSGAMISAPERRGSGSNWILSTNREGRFTLKRSVSDKDDEPFRIQVERDGYETLLTDKIYEWGNREIVLRIQSGSPLQITVRSAVDGQPVERFGARLHHRGQRNFWSSSDDDIRGGWEHEGGILRLKRVLPGSYSVEIEVAKDAPVAMGTAPVEVVKGQPAQVEITLPRRVLQPLKVLFADGQPAVGSLVQLIDSHGTEFPEHATPHSRSSGRWSSADVGHEVTKSEVDADGRASISGPEGTPLVLRVSGDHGPLVIQEFALSEDERVLELPAPATANIQVEPKEVVDQWFKTLGTLDEEDQSRVQPHVVLISQTDPRVRFPKHRTVIGVGENGKLTPSGEAELTGIPAGSWNAVIRFPDGGGSRSTATLAELDIAEGDQLDLQFDVAGERTGTIEVEARLNGEPFEGSVYLRIPDSNDRSRSRQIRTDETGAGMVAAPIGRYRIELMVRVGRSFVAVPTNTQVIAAAGQTSRVSVEASIVERSLRVLKPDGSRYEGMVPTARPPGLGPYASLQRSVNSTDLRMDGAPGVYRIVLPIRSLSTREALNELRTRIFAGWEPGMDRQPLLDALEAQAMVEVGTVTLEAGTGVLELRLPESWNR